MLIILSWLVNFYLMKEKVKISFSYVLFYLWWLWYFRADGNCVSVPNKVLCFLDIQFQALCVFEMQIRQIHLILFICLFCYFSLSWKSTDLYMQFFKKYFKMPLLNRNYLGKGTLNLLISVVISTK